MTKPIQAGVLRFENPHNASPIQDGADALGGWGIERDELPPQLGNWIVVLPRESGAPCIAHSALLILPFVGSEILQALTSSLGLRCSRCEDSVRRVPNQRVQQGLMDPANTRIGVRVIRAKQPAGGIGQRHPRSIAKPRASAPESPAALRLGLSPRRCAPSSLSDALASESSFHRGANSGAGSDERSLLETRRRRADSSW